jgi:hypothetical protein
LCGIEQKEGKRERSDEPHPPRPWRLEELRR